jgi:glutaminyl-tRNA synthetase
LDASYWPRDIPKEGTRKLPFGREIYIEREDFMEEPPKKYFRLAPGREVRLRHAYIMKCEAAVKDPATGDIVELRCTYDPDTLTGPPADGRKVKGTIHWLAAAQALRCEVRLYDRLFSVPDPDNVPEGEDFTANLNPESLVVLRDSLVEPSVRDDPPGTRYQFERQGYFVSDSVDSQPGAVVFNRTVTLRDTWAKIAGNSG